GLAPVRPGRGDPVKDGVKRPPARRPAVLSLRTALRSALRTALLRLLLALGLPVLLVTGWWFASAGSTDVYWPPLRTVLETGREVWTAERITADVVPSITRLLLGYLAAAVLGVALGLVIGSFPRV